jgi:hypothetical protein
LFQPGRLDRFQQVVDRVDFERFDRVLVVGRNENHCRTVRILAQQAPRHLESGQPGHLDV